jgi:GTPase SAR1 family protein
VDRWPQTDSVWFDLLLEDHLTWATLKQEVDRLLDSSIEAARNYPELAEFQCSLSRQRELIGEPMRIAFIGGVNNGKSTLINAFLGESLAATGNRELTYNVSWFRYGKEKRLLIHNKNGEVEENSFDTLDALVTRCEENRELLDRIRYIEVRHPAELLQRFDLIDTPGLYSAHRSDSENTQRFLVDQQTRPHAIVFVFSEALKAHDLEELEAFHRLNDSPVTGITAIGALTKVDEFERGLDSAARVVAQIRTDHPWTSRSLYGIVPIMGQIGYGAQTLLPAEEQTLLALAALTETETRILLLDAKCFAEQQFADERYPAAGERMRLFERLGIVGVRKAISLLRAGQPIVAIRSELLAQSNLEKLHEIVTSHFGNRAVLIKIRSALNAARAQAFTLGLQLRGPAQEFAQGLVRQIDSIQARETRFREFTVLEKYYRGALDLNPQDLSQLLEVTGEHGISCARRLGVCDDTPIRDLIALAVRRQSAWRLKSTDYWANEEVKETARVLVQSYGEIHGRLVEAERLLQAAADQLAYAF